MGAPTPSPIFLMFQVSMNQVQCRGILEVLKDSLEDRPQQQGRDMAEAEVRYKLIIDPSEDDSLIRLLFSFGVLQRKETRIFVCSDFPGDSQLQKVRCWQAYNAMAVGFVGPYHCPFFCLLPSLSPSSLFPSFRSAQ